MCDSVCDNLFCILNGACNYLIFIFLHIYQWYNSKWIVYIHHTQLVLYVNFSFLLKLIQLSFFFSFLFGFIDHIGLLKDVIYLPFFLQCIDSLISYV